MLAAHLVLALAIAAIWLPSLPAIAGVRIPPWAILFCAALALASYSGIVDAKGWLSIGFLGALLIGSTTAPAGPRFNLRGVFQTATVLMLFGFAIQQIPGFTGTTFISGVRLSADAAPMRLTARFDVGMAALFLAALFCSRVRSVTELRSIVAPTVAVGLVTTVVVMSSALIAGYIRFDPKWPPFALAHLGKTLLITAVVEEAFFRGVLQDRLARSRLFINGSRFRKAIPVLISAGLFGLAHLPGGWLLAAMATLAGLGYALAYALTERIEAPITVHFLVNATHFITFTYPNLAVTP